MATKETTIKEVTCYSRHIEDNTWRLGEGMDEACVKYIMDEAKALGIGEIPVEAFAMINVTYMIPVLGFLNLVKTSEHPVGLAIMSDTNEFITCFTLSTTAADGEDANGRWQFAMYDNKDEVPANTETFTLYSEWVDEAGTNHTAGDVIYEFALSLCHMVDGDNSRLHYKMLAPRIIHLACIKLPKYAGEMYKNDKSVDSVKFNYKTTQIVDGPYMSITVKDGHVSAEFADSLMRVVKVD